MNAQQEQDPAPRSHMVVGSIWFPAGSYAKDLSCWARGHSQFLAVWASSASQLALTKHTSWRNFLVVPRLELHVLTAEGQSSILDGRTKFLQLHGAAPCPQKKKKKQAENAIERVVLGRQKSVFWNLIMKMTSHHLTIFSSLESSHWVYPKMEKGRLYKDVTPRM